MAFDQEKSDAFAERFLGTLNEGALCLMTSIGHRTGLFDIMAGMAPSTSAEIADKAGLNERYVREWLNAMVTGGVVEHDSAAGQYALPAEHAAYLSRSGNGENVAVFAQYIPILGAVEDDIITCFKNGGGVPYERYPRFHEVMAEDSGQTVLPALVDQILPLAPGLVERLERGIRVLDVGCGSGRALNLMAERFPRGQYVGYDLSREAVESANAEAKERDLDNVEFVARDLSRFDEEASPESFDFVTTFDAVHDQGRPLAVLKGIQRSLKPDGIYLMQDIHGSSHVHNNMQHPLAPLLYTVSCMHCMTVSLAQGGEGLGTMWGREKAQDLLHQAGFSSVEIHQLDHDVMNDYYVIRK